MNVLKTTVLLVGVVLFASGCVSTRRAVTHVRVESDKAFIAYAEWDQGFLSSFFGAKDRSRVKRCAINPDNSLNCVDAEDINRVLNPE